jgi:hypothetical protein
VVVLDDDWIEENVARSREHIGEMVTKVLAVITLYIGDEYVGNEVALQFLEVEWQDDAIDNDMVGKNGIKVETGKEKLYICSPSMGSIWEQLFGAWCPRFLIFMKVDEVYDVILVLCVEVASNLGED